MPVAKVKCALLAGISFFSGEVVSAGSLVDDPLYRAAEVASVRGDLEEVAENLEDLIVSGVADSFSARERELLWVEGIRAQLEGGRSEPLARLIASCPAPILETLKADEALTSRLFQLGAFSEVTRLLSRSDGSVSTLSRADLFRLYLSYVMMGRAPEARALATRLEPTEAREKYPVAWGLVTLGEFDQARLVLDAFPAAELSREGRELRLWISLRQQESPDALRKWFTALPVNADDQAWREHFHLLRHAFANDLPAYRVAIADLIELAGLDHPLTPFLTLEVLLGQDRRVGETLADLELFIDENGDSSAAHDAALHYVARGGDGARFQAESFAQLTSWPGRMHFAQGVFSLGATRSSQAASRFAESLNKSSTRWQSALARANLAITSREPNALQGGSTDSSSDLLSGKAQLRRILLAEAPLDAMAMGAQLGQWLREYSGHPLEIDALMLLSEFHLNQIPPQVQRAEEVVSSLDTLELSLAQQQAVAFLRVWIVFVSGESEKLIREAESFLQRYPETDKKAQLHALLALGYVDLQQPARAVESLDKITRLDPAYAAQLNVSLHAALLTDNDEERERRLRLLATGEGQGADLAHYALGVLLFDRGELEAGREQLRLITEGDAEKRSQIHWHALADQAFSWFRQGEGEPSGGETQNLLFERSEQAFRDFLNQCYEEQAPSQYVVMGETWLAQIQMKLGEGGDALESYTQALNASQAALSVGNVAEAALGASDPSANDTELTERWVYRAGFGAIDLLAKEKRWDEAIQIADYLTAIGGSRSIESTDLAERLRLKNWVWGE